MAVLKEEVSREIDQKVVTGVQISYDGATTNIQEISYTDKVTVTAMCLKKPNVYQSWYTRGNYSTTSLADSTSIYGTDIENDTTPSRSTFPNYGTVGDLRYFGWRSWHNIYSSIEDFSTNTSVQNTINGKIWNVLTSLRDNPTILVKDGTGNNAKVIGVNMSINHIDDNLWNTPGKFAAYFLYFAKVRNVNFLPATSSSDAYSLNSKVSTPVINFASI